MSNKKSPADNAQNALEQLYDNPTARISALQEVRPSDQDIAEQATIFNAVGNEDRLRILEALRDSEYCGCELQVVLDAPQSTVATHLQKLKETGLVESRRKGKWTYYRIADAAVVGLLDFARAIQEDR